MLGDKIRELRKENKITQEELGKNIGVTTSMVGMYETNARNPSFDVLNKIADYFGVTVDYLLGRSKSKTHTLEDQENYIKNINLDTAENAMKFILEQPALMAYGGYDLDSMDEDEIINLANDMLFAMKLAVEKNKKK